MFPENRIADQDVQRAAAEDGGGAAEEGGQHQAHLRVPGGGGYQGEARAIKGILKLPLIQLLSLG